MVLWDMPAPRQPWLPCRAVLQPDGLYLEARQIAPSELQDAFMQETIARVPATETILQLQRAALGRASAGSMPAGLIFHVARCGSTLVSQLLKQCDDVVVYAEPRPINEILLPPHPWPRAEIVAALRSLAPVFAQHAGRPYMLKFSSWNSLYAELLLEAFAGTPWVLCWRDPAEVAVSLQREAPAWLREGSEPAQRLRAVVDPANTCADPERYLARLYAAFCDAAAQLPADQGRLVDYAQLPGAVWQDVAPHFGLKADLPVRRRMAAAAALQAKAPLGRARPFVPDSAVKQAAAGDALRAALLETAYPALARLTAKFQRPRM
jgi:hypothetical protein